MRYVVLLCTVMTVFLPCFTSVQAADCNTNGTADATEIAVNPALDCNTNGDIDACDVVVVSYASTNVPLAIPDFNSSGMTNGSVDSTLSVAGSRIITDLNVQLSIQHTTANNLGMLLMHGATTCTLGYRNGGTGDNFTGTVFDDQASLAITAITQGGAPYSNSYRPETLLSVFNGQTENGTWTLQCLDTNDPNTGTLLAWSLFISAGTTNTAVDCNTNGTPDTCEIAGHDCNTNQTMDACDLAGGAGDCNSNSTPDACEGDCNTNGTADICDLPVPIDASTSLTNSSAVRIPDDQSAAGEGAFRSVTIGTNATVSDVNVRLSIRHTADNHLDIFLIHGTTTVALSTDNGGTGDNYTGTVFDQSAAVSISSTAATVPYTGTFRPEGNLDLFNGQNKFGGWTLNARDDTFGDTGTLLNWTLVVLAGVAHDCNSNGTPDECDAAFGGFTDANTDRILDLCQDCNTNGIADPLESPDCNTNSTLDLCELVGHDCNTNGTFDACELAGHDCNSNQTPDTCEIAGHDCNTNNTPDDCEGGCNTNGTPDVCEGGCNSNGTPDVCEGPRLPFAASGLPLLIPGGNPNGILSTINLSGVTAVTDVDLQLSIRDTFVYDISVSLIHGTTTVDITSENGGDGDNYTNTYFDDEAPTAVTAGSAPFSSTYRPEQPLSVFVGGSPAGGWTLKVRDLFSIDTGTLLAWTLFIRTPAGDCNTNGTPDACDVDCNANGTPDACEPAGPDCNTDGVPDLCEFGVGDVAINHYLAGNPTNAYFADANRPQVVADDFVLPAQRGITRVQVHGFFTGMTVPAASLDAFTVKFWTDLNSNGVHVPGTLEYSAVLSGASVGRTLLTGSQFEISLALNSPATLAAGTHWCEVYYSGTGTASGGGTPQWAWFFTNVADAATVTIATGLPENWSVTAFAERSLEFKLFSPALTDCDANGTLDVCEFTGPDCNSNGTEDACDPDCNTDGTPDTCELAGHDCNSNGALDACEGDCDTNATLDACEMASRDCNTDGTLDVCGVILSFSATDTPISIPDINTSGILSTILVNAAGAVADVDLQLSIRHTFDFDIGVILIHGSTTLDITSGNGENGDNYTNTVFDDSAATAVTLGGAPFSYTYQPEQALSAFNGGPGSGAWTLKVRDDVPTDTGTLLSWSLRLRVLPPDCNTDGTPDICDADCNTNATSDTCDLAANPALDANSNGTPDVCDAACACRGDLNGDGRVDGGDIQCFVECFFNGTATNCPSCGCADMNNDNDIDIADVNDFIFGLLIGAPCA